LISFIKEASDTFFAEETFENIYILIHTICAIRMTLGNASPVAYNQGGQWRICLLRLCPQQVYLHTNALTFYYPHTPQMNRLVAYTIEFVYTPPPSLTRIS